MNHHDNRPDPDRLLTPREVADMFRVTIGSVEHWAQDGRLASIRTPVGRYRFRETVVREHLRTAQS